MTWTVIASTAAEIAAEDEGKLPLWVTVLGSTAAVLLSSSAVAAAFGAVRSGAAERRREYTGAARTLTAWTEYPWRIRRRTSNSPEVLAGLAERGHDLQEALADREAWCAAEHEVMGELVAHLRVHLSLTVRPAIEDAWAKHEPITEPERMNLGDGFTVDSRPDELRACFNACVHERFGWGRLQPNLRARVQAHLTAHSFPPLP